MSIYLINDMDINTYLGGAELDDKALIELLDQDIIFKTSGQLNVFGVNADDFYIISNFTGLTDATKQNLINDCNYIIYEKDFKLCKSRVPDTYPTPHPYLPVTELCNVDFYEAAKYVVCITNYQEEVYKANTNAKTTNINGVIFSDSELNLIEKYIDSDKNEKAYIYAVKNHYQLSSNYAKHNDIDFDIIPKLPREKFLEKISKYPVNVFITPITESCSRQCIENKIFNTHIIAGTNIGVMHEQWFNVLSGRALFDYIKYDVKIKIKKKFDKIIKEYV
jgi:hypothetical protein